MSIVLRLVGHTFNNPELPVFDGVTPGEGEIDALGHWWFSSPAFRYSDLSGKGHHLAPIAGVTERIGYVTIHDGSSFETNVPDQKEGTIFAVVRKNNIGNSVICGSLGSTFGHSLMLDYKGNQKVDVQARMGSDPTNLVLGTSYSYQNNEWLCVAFTWDASGLKVYVPKESTPLVFTYSYTPAGEPLGETFNIGQFSGGGDSKSIDMADCQIYGEALTENLILEKFERAKSRLQRYGIVI
ncbi:hypothetical protein DUG79_25670 [Vibrio parahaemolyticus]|nr:hypothetical protein [Vibrio parahaemolyticus]